MASTRQVEGAKQESGELVEVDLTPFNRWLGVPYGGNQLKEPFVVGDFRRWVMSSENFNPLHWDDDWAAASRYGQIIAPQSFMGIPDLGMGISQTSAQQLVPYHAGDEFFFYGPRVVAGEKYRIDRVPTGARSTKTRMGPCVFGTADVTFSTERGPVLRRRVTTMYVPRDNMKKLGDRIVAGMVDEEPEWGNEQIERIEAQKIEYIKSIRTHAKRLFGSVKIGDKLQRSIMGPLTGVTIAFSDRVRMDAWGMTHVPADQPPAFPSGKTEPGVDPELAKLNPRRYGYEGTHLTEGAARHHYYNKYAKAGGMPRADLVGSTTSIWSVDYLSNWAGEWGFLRHSTIRFNLPILSGDIVNIDGVVTGLTPGPAGFGTVHVAFTFEDQNGVRNTTGTGEIELPLA